VDQRNGGLFINSSVVYGDVRKGLQTEILVAMDKVVVTDDLFIENGQQLGPWYLVPSSTSGLPSVRAFIRATCDARITPRT
jgi:hypothetical protein